jgi:predicted protein tyrosine phosphatase
VIIDWATRQTICGIDELPSHGQAGVTHVLSIVDPEVETLEHLDAYPEHERLTLRFHDVIVPMPGMTLPQREHVARLLAFGRDLDAAGGGHLLVHCHAGVSRSTAAMASLLLQAHPDTDEDALFAHIESIRPQAWPNSRMIAFADELLDRGGRLDRALRRFHGRRLRAQPGLADLMQELGRSDELERAC